MDPKGKVSRWSVRIKTREEGSEEVKGAENEKRGHPGMQPSRNETDDGFIRCEVEDRQEARVEVLGPKKKSNTCAIRRNARLRA